MGSDHAARDKRAIRARVLVARAAAAVGDPRGRAGRRAAAAIAPLLAGARVVASYAALPGEPPTDALPLGPGVTVLLPRLLPDGGLEFAVAGPLRPGPRGTREPAGPAVPLAVADAVVVPALAADRTGVRLGRGGGGYDRALRHVRPGAPVVALLGDDAELYDRLPAEPHDVRVTAIAVPSGLLVVTGTGGSTAGRGDFP